MFWIYVLLFAAFLIGGYLIGWHRGKNGLGLWPLSVGKDGIHRQPLVVFALLGALSLSVACTDRYAPAKAPADTTAVADSDRHDGDHDRNHDKGKHKHPHEDQR